MDVVDKTKRSAVMRAVKSRDTGVEMIVRRLLHASGFRYRLHRKDLPGKPDIVFVSKKKTVFIHGCFWHQHPNCQLADRPASNIEYWNAKLDRNIERDAKNVRNLEDLGWQVYVVWECQTRDKITLLNDLTDFLDGK